MQKNRKTENQTNHIPTLICNEAAVLRSRRDDYEPHSGTVFTLQTTV